VSQPATGPAVDWKPPAPKPERSVEVYEDQPPQTGEGKTAIRFLSREACNFKGEDGKKCQLKLLVERIIPSGFQWDEAHAGGQQAFDFKNAFYVKRCAIHGPSSDKILEYAKKHYKVPAVAENFD
jgi:hypothetical protein